MMPIVWDVSASFLPIKRGSVISAVRIRFTLVLVGGKIIGVCAFFRANAGVCIICMAELMIQVPGVRQRSTLWVMSIVLTSFILVSVLIVGALIMADFSLLQKDINDNRDVFSFFGAFRKQILSIENQLATYLFMRSWS